MILAIIKIGLIIGIIGWILYRESKRKERLATLYRSSEQAKELADRAAQVRQHINEQFDELFHKIDAKMPKPQRRIHKESVHDLSEMEAAKTGRQVNYTRKGRAVGFYEKGKGIPVSLFEPIESMIKSMQAGTELEVQVITFKAIKKLPDLREEGYIILKPYKKTRHTLFPTS